MPLRRKLCGRCRGRELTANVAGIGAAEQILPMADGK